MHPHPAQVPGGYAPTQRPIDARIMSFVSNCRFNRLEEKMAQQRGMKRAEKVLARKQKKRVQAKAANIRRAERQADGVEKEEVKAEG
jgi:hypothetical protein